jgi:hypothetical protein
VTNWAEYDAGLRARGQPDRLVHAGGSCGLGGSAAHQPGRAALLLGAGHHDGPDVASRVPLGAAAQAATASGVN